MSHAARLLLTASTVRGFCAQNCLTPCRTPAYFFFRHAGTWCTCAHYGEVIPMPSVRRRPARAKRSSTKAKPATHHRIDSDRQRLITRVLTGLAPYVPEGTLKVDESGMIVVGVDDVPLAIQVEEEPPVVRVLGTVVSDVPFSEDLCAWLNEVNANRLRIGYAYWRDDEIRYAIDQIAAPFLLEHLLDALAAASEMVPALAREAVLWFPEKVAVA